MSEQPFAASGRTLLAGKIISDFGQTSIDCVVRRMSDRGATLTIESLLGIPDRFHLLIPNHGPPRPCRRIWQSGNELGLEFEAGEAKEAAPPAAAPSERRTDQLQRNQMLALRSAMDEIETGVVLLDSDLRAQFINSAFRKMWTLPDSVADSKPSFVTLMYHGRDTGAYEVSAPEMETYVAERIELVRAGDRSPRDLRRSNGEVIRMQCVVLPNGGRMLSYTYVTDIVRNADLLEKFATIDSMTGLYNRRHFMVLAETEWGRFQRYQRPLSMLILDIDHFKSVNDRYGHAVGDEAIISLAASCQRGKRNSDIAGRLGGDEFAILLPETDAAQALVAAERIRESVAAEPLTTHHFNVTISVGIATASLGMSGVDVLLRAADQALYRAKQAGRNRVVAWSAPSAPELATE